MNLDDIGHIQQLDRSGMLGQIEALPGQLEQGWKMGQDYPLPTFRKISSVLIAGMGSSAIGADLLARYASAACPAPVIVHRDYDLPAWAGGEETLVIASSYSGNTEETLSAYQSAQRQGCHMLCLCTDGALGTRARLDGVPVWNIPECGVPQSSVGYSFGLMLAALVRLGLLPDPEAELAEANSEMLIQQVSLGAGVKVARNPAKRLAGQLFGRWVSVIGSGYMAPVARRWKTQINALAKAWAQFEVLPEADHNTVEGMLNPVDVLTRTVTIFLRSSSDHPRNKLRSNLTRQGFMIAGLNTDSFDAKGSSPMANIWSALQFGDYVAFYLAMAYGVDPTPVEAMEAIKAALKE